MPIVEDFKDYTVQTKSTWAGAWVDQPHLICNHFTRAVMPSIDRASFKWRAGEVMQAGESTYSTVTPLDLDGHYVKVTIPSLSITWVGYITSDRTSRTSEFVDGAVKKIKTETPDFTAVGIEWFFGRTPIDSSVIYGTAGVATRIGRAIGYNTGSGGGRSVNYAERGNKDTRVIGFDPVFAEKPSTRSPWTAYDILKNLLTFHGPRDASNVAGPFTINVVATSLNFLDWHTPEIKTEGRTLLQVLNTLIDRRRGLLWYLDYDDTANEFDLRVSSGLPSSLALPGGAIIPASLVSQNYDFDSDRAVDRCTIGKDSTQKYSRVKVRGARRRSVFTVAKADSNWESNWNAADETDYKAGAAPNTDAKKNDRYRKASKFERVYQAFRIPQGWNGRSGKGDGIASHEYVSPEMSQGSIAINGGQDVSSYGLRLLRTTPLKAGYDYTDATAPVGSVPLDADNEFLQPFALIKHGGKFVFLDRSSGHEDEDDSSAGKLKTSYSLRPLASVPGYDIVPQSAMPHALAENHFDPSSDGASGTKPEIDYEDIRLTVCAEWDSYCEGFAPAVDPTDNPMQELLIYIGDRFRLDYLAVNTIFDIDDSGQPRYCNTGGPIQDDRTKCQDLAETAYSWYQQSRRSLAMTYHNIQEPVPLGSLIKNIGAAGEAYEQTINATVTSITHRVEDGKTSMTAAFAELDFGGLV